MFQSELFLGSPVRSEDEDLGTRPSLQEGRFGLFFLLASSALSREDFLATENCLVETVKGFFEGAEEAAVDDKVSVATDRITKRTKKIFRCDCPMIFLEHLCTSRSLSV